MKCLIIQSWILISIKSTCTHGVTLFYNWPLKPGYSTAEVQQNYGQGQAGCLGSTEPQRHPALDYDSIYFPGNTLSYIDLVVGDDTNFNDFAFTFTTLITSPYVGTIFHYRQVGTSAATVFKELKLSIDGTNIVFETFQTDDTYNNYDVFPNYFETNTGTYSPWLTFAISYDLSKPEFKIMTDQGDTETIKPNCPEDVYLGQPGVIRVGSDVEGLAPLQGHVCCFKLYSTKFGAGDFTDVLDDCISSNWVYTPSFIIEPVLTCSEIPGLFHNVANDVIPTAPPMDDVYTSSRIYCADHCLNTEGCRSFTIAKSQTSCKLYNITESPSFTASVGSKYYAKTEHCSC